MLYLRWLWLALGVLWTLPNTLVGLMAGAAAMAQGAHWHWRRADMALVFHGVPWGPGGALTLGNVILYTGSDLDSPCLTYAHRAGKGEEPAILLSAHERAHVFQYMALGPLFLPLYFMHGGVHWTNRFERAADVYAITGQGWWPWSKALHWPDL
ncbi:hypothetical protein V3390_07790 [Luteimonas sp. FXH3W]|uniref:Uncharacterized protein n=1 Tax=Aquilutibacter rugosus TaxID=3115820 RepID=A0ABU7V231_9GAMM